MGLQCTEPRFGMRSLKLSLSLLRKRERERERERFRAYVHNINSYIHIKHCTVVIFLCILILYVIVRIERAKTFLLFARNMLELIAWCPRAFFYFPLPPYLPYLGSSWYDNGTHQDRDLNLNLRSLGTSFRAFAVNANFSYRPFALDSKAFSYLSAQIFHCVTWTLRRIRRADRTPVTQIRFSCAFMTPE